MGSWPPPARGCHHAASGPHRICPAPSGAPVPGTSPTRPVPPGLTAPHCPPAWRPPLCPGSLFIRPSQVVPTGNSPPAQPQGCCTLGSCWQRGGPARDLRPLPRAVTAWWHRHSAAACRAAGPGSTSRSTRSCGCGREPRTSTGARRPPWPSGDRATLGGGGKAGTQAVPACVVLSGGRTHEQVTVAEGAGTGQLETRRAPRWLEQSWRGCSCRRAVWGPLTRVWGPVGAPQRHCSG